MKEPELKPFDDYETIKKKADEYIARILYGVHLFERCNYSRGIKPTVFISVDILSIIGRGSERTLLYSNVSPTERILTVCGYNVKTVADTNVLSIGFDLL